MNRVYTALPDIELPLMMDSHYLAYTHRIYGYMLFALLITGCAAFYGTHSVSLLRWMYVIQGGQIISLRTAGWVVLFMPLLLILFIGWGLANLSLGALRFSLFLYAALVGLSLASLAFIYTGTDIATAFFTAGAMFGGMSLYGYITQRDLSKMGSIFGMLLWGLILTMLLGFLLHSSQLELVISLVAVVLFCGLTAYDSQKIRRLYMQMSDNDAARHRLAVMGALSLYLDVLNLFLNLLPLFGRRRR